jgi:hypothetical protein
MVDVLAQTVPRGDSFVASEIPGGGRLCQKPSSPATASDYERRVAKDIVMMLLETRVDARRVLALVDAMLHLKLPGDDPHPSDAA